MRSKQAADRGRIAAGHDGALNRTPHMGLDYLVTPPREAALRVLARRFPDYTRPTEDTSAGQPPPVFTLTTFQHDAVRRAHHILARRRGVLIADSVGLGKTYIALALIEAALRVGERVAVVTPAVLRRNWMVPLGKLANTIGLDSFRQMRMHADSLTDSLAGPHAGAYTGSNAGSHTGAHTGSPTDSHAGTSAPAHANAHARAPNEPAAHPRTPLLVWTSHTRLGRGTAPEALQQGLDLVVIDEAHAFRNPHTRRYRALAEVTRTARLVLLTATPINNSPADLYHLIRLFAGDGDFHDLGIPDLRETFRAAATAPHTGQAAPSLQPLMAEIMIRRTRTLVGYGMGADTTVEPTAKVAAPRPDLTEARSGPDVAGTALRFPHRAPPRAVRYALDQVYDGFLPELAATLADLTLAPFRLAAYGANLPGTATNAPDELIRIGLMKRLESSLAAFRASIARQLRFTTAFLASLERGLLRLPADQRTLFARGDETGAQLSLEELTLRPLPPGLDLARLRDDANSDRQRLDTLHRRLAALSSENCQMPAPKSSGTGRPPGPHRHVAAAPGRSCDPKLARLLMLLDDELRGEKVVVFTEFRETARYLWRALRARGATALIDGGGAFLGNGPAGRQEVIARFAPHANHAPPPPPHERVDLLLATDVLAEGLNLQDARIVISYDLPWNPVRLMQRIGRVDRIGSPHQTVFPYHFLPDHGLDELLRLVDRLQLKLTGIRQTIGEEFVMMGEAREAEARETPGHEAGARAISTRDAELASTRAAMAITADELERGDLLAAGTDELLRGAYYRALHATPAQSGATSQSTDQAPTRPGAPMRADAPTPATARTTVDRPIPVAASAPGSPGCSHHVLVACRIGERLTFLIYDPAARAAREDDTLAAEILLAALATEDDPQPPDPTIIPRAWRAARKLARERLATTSAVPPLSPTAPGARAARRLMDELSAHPGGPDPDLCRRADRLLPLLARRHDAGTEARITSALRAEHPGSKPHQQGTPDLLHSLETALAHAAKRPTSTTDLTIELIGIIERRPRG